MGIDGADSFRRRISNRCCSWIYDMLRQNCHHCCSHIQTDLLRSSSAQYAASTIPARKHPDRPCTASDILLMSKRATAWTLLRWNSSSPGVVPHVKAGTAALCAGHVPGLAVAGPTQPTHIGRFRGVRSIQRNGRLRLLTLDGT
jgi:hypothetical protein